MSETFREPINRKSVQGNNFVRLQAFSSIGNDEFNFLTFFDSPVSIDFDRTVMEENIPARFTFDETVTLGIVEPLYFAFFFLGHFCTTFFQVLLSQCRHLHPQCY